MRGCVLEAGGSQSPPPHSAGGYEPCPGGHKQLQGDAEFGIHYANCHTDDAKLLNSYAKLLIGYAHY